MSWEAIGAIGDFMGGLVVIVSVAWWRERVDRGIDSRLEESGRG